MRKFISIFIWFSFVILSFNVIVFCFAQNNYFKDYVKKPNKKFSNYIFSDSHGLPLKNGTEQYNVFNYSAGSETYIDIKRKLDFLLSNEYKIDTVYLTVGNHTLSTYRERMNNIDRSIVYASPNHYDNYYSYVKEKYITYFFPIFSPKIRSILKSFLLTKLSKMMSNKAGKPSKKWANLSEDEMLVKSQIRKDIQFSKNTKSLKLVNALSEIISICKQEDIEIIGLKFPLTKSYTTAIGNLNTGADSIFVEHQFKILDYTKNKKFTDKYFKNQDHLNTEGGALLVDMIFNSSN